MRFTTPGRIWLPKQNASVLEDVHTGSVALIVGSSTPPPETAQVPPTSVNLVAGVQSPFLFIVVTVVNGVVNLIVGVAGGLAGSTVGTITGPVVLVSVFLDLGDEHMAAVDVTHPSRLYEGRVTGFGTVERSIPVPVGPPSIGNMTMTWADADHKWRKLLAKRTPYRRLLEVKVGAEGASEVLFLVAYKGEITDVTFDQENVSVEVADITARWFDVPLPSLINKTNFPNAAVDDEFFPFVFGQVFDERDPPQGSIKCHLIDTTLNRYSVARHSCEAVPSIFVKTPDDDIFVVNTFPFTLLELTQTIDRVEYTLVCMDFDNPLPEGTEVRCDVDGANLRGAFGTMTPASGTLRNPIDALINMLFYASLIQPQIARYNVDSFQRVRDQFTALNWNCDGAIVEVMTIREFLGQLLTSVQLDLYQNRKAELEVNLTVGHDPERTVLSDLTHLLAESVHQSLPSPTYNRIVYRFGRMYADNVFAKTRVLDNLQDQYELTVPFEETPIQPETVELPFVRDEETAEAVMANRASYQDLASYRFQAVLSAPQVLELVELGTRVGITHAGGIQDGGWVNEEFKVYRETLDLEQLKLTIGAVRRVQPSLTPVILSACPVDGQLNVPYRQMFLARSGTFPYTWTLTAGDLPEGLTLNPDGSITGTPTETGVYSFTVTLSDNASPPVTATKSCNITVRDPDNPLVPIRSFLYSDPFDGCGAAMPAWTNVQGGVSGITENCSGGVEFRFNNGNPDGHLWYNAAPVNMADQWVEMIYLSAQYSETWPFVAALMGGPDVLMQLDGSNRLSGYHVCVENSGFFNPPSIQLVRWITGFASVYTYVLDGITIGDRIRLEARVPAGGDVNLRVYKNNSLLINVNDTSNASRFGRPGLGASNTISPNHYPLNHQTWARWRCGSFVP